MSNSSENTTDLDYDYYQEKVDHFDGLPAEMLSEIFSYFNMADLIEMGKVCKRFNDVAQSRGRFWRKVVLSPSYYRLPHTLLGDIVSVAGDSIRELDLSGRHIQFPVFLPHSKAADKDFHIKLETLNLSGTCFFEEECDYLDVRTRSVYKGTGIAAIMEKCKAKQVILDDQKMWRVPFCDAFEKNEQIECVSLEYFDIYDESRKINFEHFFAKFNNLKVLNLSNSCLSMDQLRQMCRYLPETLEEFMLTNVDLKEHYLEIFENVVKCAPNLKVLGMSPYYLRISAAVVANLNKLKKLHSLRLNEWKRAIYQTEKFLRIIPNLKHVDFVGDEEKMEIIRRNRKEQIHNYELPAIWRNRCGISSTWLPSAAHLMLKRS